MGARNRLLDTTTVFNGHKAKTGMCGYKHVCKVKKRLANMKEAYTFSFMFHGVKYAGTCQTAKAAALALDRIFIRLKLYDKLQILKPVKSV